MPPVFIFQDDCASIRRNWTFNFKVLFKVPSRPTKFAPHMQLNIFNSLSCI
jgi:hypothetical protein